MAGIDVSTLVDTVLAKLDGAATARIGKATHKVDSTELLEDVQGNAAEMS